MSNKVSPGNQEVQNHMNTLVIENFSKLKRTAFILPLVLIVVLVGFLLSQGPLSVANYVAVQKDLFIFINSKLSQFPSTIFNLTQLGDALIALSLLSLFVLYAPKMWEALLSGSIVSAVLSNVLKNLFSVPRPAEAFDHSTFVIIGRVMPGFSSLPSGHSITVFTTLTIVLYAFMPQKLKSKCLWVCSLVFIGLILVSTRVGVGAHFPLDVLSGSIVGYISGLIGIVITQKYKLWSWIAIRKYYPILIGLFLISAVLIAVKIATENLIVFDLTLLALLVSLYKIIYVYIKK
jgi:membrane-associated phospholipid phosphatase